MTWAFALCVASVLAVPVSGVELRAGHQGQGLSLDGIPALISVRKGEALSKAAVRRSLERVMETGRFADVVVTLEGDEDAPRVIFTVWPKVKVATVDVEGNRALSAAQVQALAQVSPETLYDGPSLEDVAERVRAAYGRRGYPQARVRLSTQDVEGAVGLKLFIDEGEPARLRRLTLGGQPFGTAGALEEALGLKLGDVLSLEEVEAGVERLAQALRAQKRWRARVDKPVVDLSTGDVWLSVVAGPVVEIRFRGAGHFSDGLLVRVLDYRGEERLDEAVSSRLAARLSHFYRLHGFLEARVQARFQESPEGRRGALVFIVEEGPRFVLRHVTFSGRQALGERRLRDTVTQMVAAAVSEARGDIFTAKDPLGLEGHPTSGAGPSDAFAPEAQTVFAEDALLEAAGALTELYRTEGYLNAQVSLASAEVVDGLIDVTFDVREGDRITVAKVVVQGLPSDLLAPAFALLDVGEPVSPQAVAQSRSSLNRELERFGYLFSRVKPQVALDDKAKATVTFNVESGPKVLVGRILLRGHQRTDERLIEGAIGLKSGDAADPEALVTAQRSLLSLGIFTTAEVRLLSPERVEAVKDVLVQLVERPRISGEVGVGYFLAEGPRVVADGELPNLFGKAVSLSARLKAFFFEASLPARSGQVDVSDLAWYETFGGRASVSAQSKGLLPWGLGARIDLVGERVFRQSYRFSRAAAVPGLDWSRSFVVPGIDWARLKLSLQLQYEIETSVVSRVQSRSTAPLLRADQERLRFLSGNFSLNSLRFTPTLDLRDDPSNPRRGVLLQLDAESTLDLFTRDENNAYVPVKFAKLSGTLTGYVPLPARSSLALSVRGGRVFPFVLGSVTPPVKRFFLGGSSTMRGFPEESLVAEDQRQEYGRQVRECQQLASTFGCTPAAQTLLAGRNVASQGGELFLLGKAELRFPVWRSLDLGLFFEAGNLWLAPPKTPWPLRTVAGGGVRYLTPIGPLALDVGFNLAPDVAVNEPVFNIHFNIGVF